MSWPQQQIELNLVFQQRKTLVEFTLSTNENSWLRKPWTDIHIGHGHAQLFLPVTPLQKLDPKQAKFGQTGLNWPGLELYWNPWQLLIKCVSQKGGESILGRDWKPNIGDRGGLIVGGDIYAAPPSLLWRATIISERKEYRKKKAWKVVRRNYYILLSPLESWSLTWLPLSLPSIMLMFKLMAVMIAETAKELIWEAQQWIEGGKVFSCLKAKLHPSHS